MKRKRKILENYTSEEKGTSLSGVKKYENSFLKNYGSDLKINNYTPSDYASSFLAITKEQQKKINNPLKDKEKISEKKTKTVYEAFVNALIKAKVKKFIIDNISLSEIKNIDNLNSITENIILMVKKDQPTYLYEGVSDGCKRILVNKILEFQCERMEYLNNFSLENFNKLKKEVEFYGKYIREAEEFIGNGNLSTSSTSSSMTVGDLVNRYGNILEDLEEKFQECNETNDDTYQIGSCQIVGLDKAMTELKKLLDDCGGNEECRSKVLNTIGRLEVLYNKIKDVILS